MDRLVSNDNMLLLLLLGEPTVGSLHANVEWDDGDSRCIGYEEEDGGGAKACTTISCMEAVELRGAGNACSREKMVVIVPHHEKSSSLWPTHSATTNIITSSHVRRCCQDLFLVLRQRQ
jgi:hypothetical protein